MKSPAIEDLYLHVTLSSLAAAAQGWAWVAKSIDREEDKIQSAVWTYHARSGLQRVSADGYGPAWASEGDGLAFIRTVDDGPQIFVCRNDRDDAQQLTRLRSGVSSIEHWDAARGRLLVRVTVQQDASQQAPCRVGHVPYKQDDVGVVEGQSVQLHCVDASTGRAEWIDCGDGDVLEAKWSPDGDTLAYIQRRSGTQRHCMDLWLKRGDRPAHQATETLVSLSGLSWSPDGARIAVAASEVEGDSISYLHVIEIDGGRTFKVGHIEMTIPSAIQWHESGERLWVTQAHRGLQRIVSTDLEGQLEVLWNPPDRQVFDMAAVDGQMGFFAAGVNDGPEFFLRGTDGGVSRISRFNAWRDDRPSLRAEKRTFEVPDGNAGDESIEGWLLTPAGEGPFPLLLDMHGGPHSMVTFEFERYVHWPALVDAGWAILALNAVGSSSYGDTFASRLCGHWGELDLPQWQSALE